MPPAVHPGRLLKRELTVRELSANRLALDIGVPSGRITDILNGGVRSRPIRPFALSAISGTAHSSGSICKANTISRWSNAIRSR